MDLTHIFPLSSVEEKRNDRELERLDILNRRIRRMEPEFTDEQVSQAARERFNKQNRYYNKVRFCFFSCLHKTDAAALLARLIWIGYSERVGKMKAICKYLKDRMALVGLQRSHMEGYLFEALGDSYSQAISKNQKALDELVSFYRRWKKAERRSSANTHSERKGIATPQRVRELSFIFSESAPQLPPEDKVMPESK